MKIEEIRRALALLYDVSEAHQIGVILREEWVMRQWNVFSIAKEGLQELRDSLGFDAVEVEITMNCSDFACRDRIGRARKLRSLSGYSGIAGHHDASVGLLEVDIALPAHEKQAIALDVRKEGRIDASAVALEVEVALAHSPETVAVGAVATGVGGERSLAYPPDAVNGWGE